MHLLDRDIELLRTLAHKVRLLSTQQIARTWWPQSGRDKAKDRLHHLHDRGYIIRGDVLAYPMLPLERPVFTWAPGDVAPDARAVSTICRTRWKVGGTAAPASTPVYIASPFTAYLLGGAGGRFHVHTVTHDLHVSELYLRFRSTDPVAAAAWVGEDVKGKAGRHLKDPDAFVEYDDGSTLVIEFAGSYTIEQVRSFHEHCHKHGLPYQLW